MSREKLTRINFVDFEEVWIRVISSTPIRKYKEIAEIVGISPSAVTTRAKKNEFPVEWAFFIAQKFGLNTDWLLTGRGERQYETKDFLTEVQNWVTETAENNPEIKIWFKVQFENKFPEFTEWKRKKEDSGTGS